jgi:hypothetical protein
MKFLSNYDNIFTESRNLSGGGLDQKPADGSPDTGGLNAPVCEDAPAPASAPSTVTPSSIDKGQYPARAVNVAKRGSDSDDPKKKKKRSFKIEYRVIKDAEHLKETAPSTSAPTGTTTGQHPSSHQSAISFGALFTANHMAYDTVDGDSDDDKKKKKKIFDDNKKSEKK